MSPTPVSATTVVVEVHRSGRWWAISVPSHPRVFSQARRLDQVEDRAREALSMALQTDEDDLGPLEVRVTPPASVAGDLAELAEASAAAAAAVANVTELRLRAVTALVDQGMPLRDIGALVGLSHQRVSQLLASSRTD